MLPGCLNVNELLQIHFGVTRNLEQTVCFKTSPKYGIADFHKCGRVTTTDINLIKNPNNTTTSNIQQKTTTVIQRRQFHFHLVASSSKFVIDITCRDE